MLFLTVKESTAITVLRENIGSGRKRYVKYPERRSYECVASALICKQNDFVTRVWAELCDASKKSVFRSRS